MPAIAAQIATRLKAYRFVLSNALPPGSRTRGIRWFIFQPNCLVSGRVDAVPKSMCPCVPATPHSSHCWLLRAHDVFLLQPLARMPCDAPCRLPSLGCRRLSSWCPRLTEQRQFPCYGLPTFQQIIATQVAPPACPGPPRCVPRCSRWLVFILAILTGYSYC